MIETKEKVINDSKYKCAQFPGRTALKFKIKLMQKIGSPVKQALSETKNSNILDTDLADGYLMVQAVTSLMEKLDCDDTLKLVMGLLAQTFKDDRPITDELFDTHFAGNLYELYELLYFVMEVNYGDFFSKITGYLRKQ